MTSTKKENTSLLLRGTLILFLMLTLSISLISAAGVATSYWDDNPLKLAPGESTVASLRLQSDGGETMLRATMDSSIAELIDGPEYTVPAGESVPVNIRITIPENSAIGTRYQVYVDFQEISSGEGGMLRVAQGITSKIPVEVVGEQESELYGVKTSPQNNLLWIALAVIAVAVILAIIINKRKR